MRKRDLAKYGFFLLITFGTFIACVENGLESRSDILYFTVGLYVLVHVVKSYSNWRMKRPLHSALHLLIGFLLFQIPLKIYYFYYNRFFSYAVIGLSVVILLLSDEQRQASLKTTRTYLLLSIIVTTITVSIPDTEYLAFLNPSNIPWKPKISWEEFKGRKFDPADSFAASINCGLRWKRNRAFDYPPAVVMSQMSPNGSTINTFWKVNQEDKKLLIHEQGHFNIKEHYCRLIRDSLREHWLLNELETKRIVYNFFRKANEADSLYDLETRHSLDRKKQEKWTNRYLELLGLKAIGQSAIE